jgi:hypothetical protein
VCKKSEVKYFGRDSSNNSTPKIFPHIEYLKPDVSIIAYSFNFQYNVSTESLRVLVSAPISYSREATIILGPKSDWPNCPQVFLQTNLITEF